MKKNILYFYVDRLTDRDREVVAAVGARTRNAASYRAGDAVEDCDGVMGCAPAIYVERFGRVAEQAEPAAVEYAKPEPAQAEAPKVAYCIHVGAGQWEIYDRGGIKLPITYPRSTAYAKVRAMNGEA